MLRLHGPKSQVREEERPVWFFEHKPSIWLNLLFNFVDGTSWEARIASPHPRVEVDHQHYRSGIDCGVVFRTFIHQKIGEFVDGHDFVDGGILGVTFCNDPQLAMCLPGLEDPPPRRFQRYEAFGKLMAGYKFYYQDFSWPRGLDPVIFLEAYFQFRRMRHAPHSSRVFGCVGKAMSFVQERKEAVGVPPTSRPSQVMYDHTNTLSWPRVIWQRIYRPQIA